MSSTDVFGLSVIVFALACFWFTRMLDVLIDRSLLILAELRGINAKLGRIEEQQKPKP